MMKNLVPIILFVVLLSGAQVAIIWWPGAPRARVQRPAASSPPMATAPKPAAKPLAAKVPVGPAPSPTPPVAHAESAEARMHTQMRAEVVRRYADTLLRIVESDSKLTLNDREHERLLDVVMDCRHAEAMVDAPLARLVSFDGSTLVMEIPPHAEQGAAVKTVFGQELHKDFPSDRAEEILQATEPRLYRLFEGLGQFDEVYTVEKPRADGQVHVTMTAKVPEAEAAENPALLALARAISGSGWFDREIIDIAHEAIVPSVDKYFPQEAARP